MKFQNGEQIQNDNTFCIISQRITEITLLQSECIQA